MRVDVPSCIRKAKPPSRMHTVSVYEIGFRKSASWDVAWGILGRAIISMYLLFCCYFLNFSPLSFSTQLTGEPEKYEKQPGHLTNIDYTMLGFADVKNSTSNSHLMGHMANRFCNFMYIIFLVTTVAVFAFLPLFIRILQEVLFVWLLSQETS